MTRNEIPTTWRELNSYERDILLTLARDEPLTGAEIKPHVDGVPGRKSQSPLYEGIENLEQRGLIGVEAKDGRADACHLTDSAWSLVEDVAGVVTGSVQT